VAGDETLEVPDLTTESPVNGIDPPDRRAIIVAGMHRSGTSALARVLNLAGCDLPKHVMPPLEGSNELGFWEPETVVQAHEQYLAKIGSSWDDVLPLPDDAFASEPALELRQQLSRLLLEEYDGSSLFVVKDPRVSRLLPLWFDVLADLGVTPATVIAVRNPLEVAGSLSARDDFSTTKSLLIWLRHTLESERDSRGRARSVVMYDELLRDWRGVLSAVGDDLGLEWPRLADEAADEVESFLSPGQRHHLVDWNTLEGRADVVTWVKEAYSALRTDDPIPVLDQVGAELAQADAIFGPLFVDARRALQTSEEQLRASVTSGEGLTAQLGRLTSERDRLTTELDTGRQELEARTAEVRELKGAVARLTKALAATEGLVQQLEAELAQKGVLRSLRRRSRSVSQFTAAVLPPTPQNLRLLGDYVRLRGSDDFDADGYAARYPDVRGAGISPRMHYVKFGRAEGRDPRPQAENGRPVATPAPTPPPSAEQTSPQPSRKLTKELRATLEEEFDRDHYLAAYPDVAEAGVDPLEHYFNAGWREGRDPSTDFSTSYYLSANPDVAAADVNPFAHYVLAGKGEGRPPRAPGGPKRETLENLRSVDEEIDHWREIHPPEAAPMDEEAFARLIAERVGTRRHVVISCSHDDYTRVAGGVQLCVQLEQDAFLERGWAHLNLHPAQRLHVLSRETEPEAMGLAVVCDGEALGIATADAVLRALADLGSEGIDFGLVVHALHGHSPEVIAELYERLEPRWAWLWLHDFFVICPSTNLLRNKIEPCHAPPPDSVGCTICVYGEERLRHVRRLRELLDRVPFKLAAPSQFMADRWREYFGNSELEVTVHEHGALMPAAPNGVGAQADVDGPIRIAFLGYPEVHKGWTVFRELVRSYARGGEYRFFQFVNGEYREPYVERRQVSVAETGPLAMIEALRADSIDLAFVWSVVEESFGFTTQEAFVAGTAVITNEGSGNVASVVRDSRNGLVFADEQELFAAFEAGSIREFALSRRSAERPEFSHFELSHVTADLVHFDD
jgi:glycosyltransferase involved in cell wall biosynthesis